MTRKASGTIISNAELENLIYKPGFIAVFPEMVLFNCVCSYCLQEWTCIREKSILKCFGCGAPISTFFRSVGFISKELFFIQEEFVQ